MNELGIIVNGLSNEYQSIVERAFSYIPSLVVTAVVLLLGWLLAVLARQLLIKTMSHLDRFWQTMSVKLDQPQLQDFHTPTKLLGNLLFWVVILFSFLLVTDILELKILRDGLKALIAFLPIVAGTALLIFVGFLGSVLARDLIIKASEAAELPNARTIGRITQILILLVVVVLGFDQLGLDIGFLSVIIGISLAAVLGSIGLAFGLGARQQVSNLLAARQIMDSLEMGDTLRIGDVEGIVTDIGASKVTIENEQSLIQIPAAQFDTQIAYILKKSEGP